MKLKNSIAAVIFLDIVLFLSIFFVSKKSILLLLICLLISFFLIRSRNDWRVYGGAVLLALVVEPTAVYFHAWQYPHPDFLSVPLWILTMWGILAVSLYRISSGFKIKL